MEIRDVDFFEGLSEETLSQLTSSSAVKDFDQDETIFEKGDPADVFYVLKEGTLELELHNGEAAVNLTRPGEIFGWSAMVEKGVYTARCTSKKPSSAFGIPKEKMEIIFNRNPKDAVILYKRIGSVFSKRLSKPVH